MHPPVCNGYLNFKIMDQEQLIAFIKSLKPGDRMIETEKSSCLYGRKGTVYISKSNGGTCILWDKMPGEDGQMGTSVTHGARLVNE